MLVDALTGASADAGSIPAASIPVVSWTVCRTRIFAKSDFTEGLRERAASENVLLLTVDDLYDERVGSILLGHGVRAAAEKARFLSRAIAATGSLRQTARSLQAAYEPGELDHLRDEWR
jgi:hypothetical protein